MLRHNTIRPIRFLASAAVVASPLAVAVTTGTAHAGSTPAPRDPGHDTVDALDEHTTLETCAADLGGTKVDHALVGYFHKVHTDDGVFNKASKGGHLDLEFRLEDTTRECVEGSLDFVWVEVDRVSCDDPWTVIDDNIDAVRSVEFEEKEGHYKAKIQLPKTKNSCYVVSTDALDTDPMRALFQTK